MCDVDKILDGCGTYSDLPADWGNETLEFDEKSLLAVGITLDIIVSLCLLFLVVIKYCEEIYDWYRKRKRGELKPYEKVADYLHTCRFILMGSY